MRKATDEKASKQRVGRNGGAFHRCGAFALPFIRCTEPELDGEIPFDLPPVVGRCFTTMCGDIPVDADADEGGGAGGRGVPPCPPAAPSFMTIFAWISSSLEALTCLGQKRVTNLFVQSNKRKGE